jgi:sulfur carrier protein
VSAGASAPLALLVNGEERSVPAGTTVAGLVEEGGPARWVAVELDGVIVPRERWAETFPSAGSRVEIVRFVQGG